MFKFKCKSKIKFGFKKWFPLQANWLLKPLLTLDPCHLLSLEAASDGGIDVAPLKECMDQAGVLNIGQLQKAPNVQEQLVRLTS